MECLVVDSIYQAQLERHASRQEIPPICKYHTAAYNVAVFGTSGLIGHCRNAVKVYLPGIYTDSTAQCIKCFCPCYAAKEDL